MIPSKSQGALYDLNVFLVLRNEGWRLACEYNSDLYDAATITRLLGDFKALLEDIVRDPNRPISHFVVSEGAAQSRRRLGTGSPTKPVESAPHSARSLGAAAAAAAAPAMAAAKAEQSRSESETEVAHCDSYELPASAAQQRFFILEEIVPGDPALHMRACVRLSGKVNIAHLEKSLRLLVERHETLRTTFQKSGDELRQIIHPALPIDLPVTALDSVPEANREEKLWESIRAEACAAIDLEAGPLVRARLFRLAPEEHVLMITAHRIIVDGWSQNVIQQDLWEIYKAVSKGEAPNLPPLAIQYGDYAHWQEEWLKSEVAAEQIAFWKKQLQPPLPVLEFPTDRPPANRPASHGAMETLLLPEHLTQSLKDFGRAEGVTPFTVLLTGYAALLCRYAGQEEIIIGSPVANRRQETEPLIGPFAGPITLRLNLAGNPTLKELLIRVRDVTLDALNNADVPLEVLMDELAVRSVHGRNPLSQCYFFYQVAFLRPRELDQLTVSPLPDFGLGTHSRTANGFTGTTRGRTRSAGVQPRLVRRHDDAAGSRRLPESARTDTGCARGAHTRIARFPARPTQAGANTAAV